MDHRLDGGVGAVGILLVISIPAQQAARPLRDCRAAGLVAMAFLLVRPLLDDGCHFRLVPDTARSEDQEVVLVAAGRALARRAPRPVRRGRSGSAAVGPILIDLAGHALAQLLDVLDGSPCAARLLLPVAFPDLGAETGGKIPAFRLT